MANMHTVSLEEQFVGSAPSPINIGATIRDFRLQRGMSQPGVEVLNLTPSEIRIGHMHQTLDRYLRSSVAAELGEE